MSRRLLGFAAGLAALLSLHARVTRADITVVGHYQFANGDTLTRASYYTNRWMRTTLPNGNEVVYSRDSDRITLIDHAGRRYWEGPRAKADSVTRRMRAERAKEMAESATPEDQQKRNAIFAALTDSVRLESTGKTEKICGYPSSEYVLTAGPYLRQERWIARSIAVPDFSDEVQNVVIATITDPLARGLMTLIVQTRSADSKDIMNQGAAQPGLALRGRIRYKTLSQEGQMSWEAVRVLSTKIPETAWLPPRDYIRWTPPGAGVAKKK
jgi:hypothetical protein